MAEQVQEMIERNEWEKYKQDYDDRHSFDKKMEIELSDHDKSDIYYCKVRRIAQDVQKDSGMVSETWELLTERDRSPKLTFFLSGGTLENHIRWCKYIDTDHGSTLFRRLTLGGLMLTYIPLLASLSGMITADLDISQWYWVAPLASTATLFVALQAYKKVATCAQLKAEVVVSKGDHHLCYVCNSPSQNVVEQIGAWDRHKDWMNKAVDGLLKVYNQRAMDREDRIHYLEWQADNRDKDTVRENRRYVNQKLGLRGNPRVTGQNNLLLTLGLMAVTAVAVGLAVYWAVKGG